MFQDVYEWAGTPRTVRISKQGNPFCFPEHIAAQADRLFAELGASNHLQNLAANEFAEGAAHLLSELNAIHAFREGNGRAQLTFCALLAHRAGHPLDLEKLEPDEMLNAMVASFGGDDSALNRVIKDLMGNKAE